ncbi:MAG: DNA recombination protein RmuC [Burkholderiales bacterium]|nr:DNA recombination protein RmuC [Burkholderiales bacterium]
MSTATVTLVAAALGAVLGAFIAALIVRAFWRAESASAALAPRFDALAAAGERLERELRAEVRESGQANRSELAQGIGEAQRTLVTQMAEVARLQNTQIDAFAKQLEGLTVANEARLVALQKAVDERLALFSQDTRANREEGANALKRFGDGINVQLGEVRTTLEARLKDIETQNAAKLDAMRQTVDERLHATLEQRLGESFKQVSSQLEAVHKGLGEMQTLATGVGDLKRVLSNVKARGTWGEVQLAALLEQILTLDQYGANVATVPGSRERVEFAVRMPGGDAAAEGGGMTWLPIDSKFPVEDYERILAAQEAADAAGLEAAGKALEARIKLEARSIRDKYIAPPHTVDFGILFVPTEGLYAEILRRPGLFDWVQRECRVTVAGPTTLAAMLTAFQQGFRTLAIQKRSSEAWRVLGAVKTEFGKFGEVLERTHKQLEAAANSIAAAQTRSRVMTRELTKVEALPDDEARRMLAADE